MTFFLNLFLCGFAFGYDAKPMSQTADFKPPEMQGVGIQERLGEKLNLDLKVQNETGETIALRELMKPGQPVVFSFVYFSCPALCNFHMNGVTNALKELKWTVGKEFQVVALSFDPNEKSDLAQAKKKNYLRLYDRAGTENGWHFLTASAGTISELTKQAGFQYKWNEQAKEWAHASAAMVLTSDGRISRYVHGIAPEAQTIRFALSEATAGKIGNFIDQVAWLCMHFDPKLSRYTLYTFRLVQFGGLVVVAILALLLIPNFIRSRRQRTTV